MASSLIFCSSIRCSRGKSCCDIDPSAPSAELKGNGDEGPQPERRSGGPTRVCTVGSGSAPDGGPNELPPVRPRNCLLMTASRSVEKGRYQKVKGLAGVQVPLSPTSLACPSTSFLTRTTDSSSPYSPFPATKPPTESPTHSVSEGNAERWFTNASIAF